MTTRSNFLDLHQFVSGVTAEKLSLEAACKAFSVEHGKVRVEQHGLITPDYIEYNRRDVEATFALCFKALSEYDRHPFSPGHPARGYKRPETRIYSTASMTKAYLADMGILPPMHKNPDFPKEILGASMEAFHGGRAEANIIRRDHQPSRDCAGLDRRGDITRFPQRSVASVTVASESSRGCTPPA